MMQVNLAPTVLVPHAGLGHSTAGRPRLMFVPWVAAAGAPR
jgi:hypothetical protein